MSDRDEAVRRGVEAYAMLYDHKEAMKWEELGTMGSTIAFRKPVEVGND